MEIVMQGVVHGKTIDLEAIRGPRTGGGWNWSCG